MNQGCCSPSLFRGPDEPFDGYKDDAKEEWQLLSLYVWGDLLEGRSAGGADAKRYRQL